MTASACFSRVTLMVLGPSTIGLPSRNRLNAADSRNQHDDWSLNTTVEWAAVPRDTSRQFSRLVVGKPQFTMIDCCLHESSNERQPAWASWLTINGGGRP